MEKDHFGDDGHANAGCRCFAVDVEGLLNTADNALQLQLCEFLHRLDGEQAGIQGNVGHHIMQAGGFSAPAPAFQPLHFLPGDNSGLPVVSNINSSSSVSEPRRFPDNRLEQFQGQGIPAKQQFLASLGISASLAGLPPPRQRWSDLGTEASFDDHLQHISQGSHRHFVRSETPDDQACIPSIRREITTPGCSSASPANIVGTSFQPRGVSLMAEDALCVQERRIVKFSRVTDQVGHIMRERLRRDDMTTKFLMLESLLPPGPKRDRATIVEHSIQHLKNLHHRMENLQQKRSDILKSSSRALPLGTQLRVRNIGATKPPLESEKKISKPNDTGKATMVFEKVQVHLNLPNEIVVEMTCRPHAHLQSQVLGVWERLGMDVAQCSVCRHRGFVLSSTVLQGNLTPLELQSLIGVGDASITAPEILFFNAISVVL